MLSNKPEMQKALSYQPEHYLVILSGLCKANWLALALLAGIFTLLEGWPRADSTMHLLFVVISVEFTAANLLLSLALKYRTWLQKAPRDALNRLRQLTALVLAWDGLHVLGVFDLFGGIDGAMASLLPILGLISFSILPCASAMRACSILLCAVLSLMGLQQLDLLIPLHDIMGSTEAVTLQSPLAYGLVLSAISFASLIFVCRLSHGLSIHDRGPNGLFDLRFNCFSLDCWHKRLQDELVRSHAQKSTTSIVVLGLKSVDESSAAINFDTLYAQLQKLSAAALASTRQDLDTIAYIGNARFALLLPTATEEKCNDVVARIQSQFPDAELKKCTSIVSQKPSDALFTGLLSELAIPAVA